MANHDPAGITPPTTIEWISGRGVRVLDQRLLPGEELYRDLETVADVAEAIETLAVRGAPLIGIAAAMGVALAAMNGGEPGGWEAAVTRLGATRPTAVNLRWALDRVALTARRSPPGELARRVLDEALAIHAEDREMCRRIGEAGVDLIPHGATVMTHCNAGALATGGMGTALAPVYLAASRGADPAVMVPETRPLLQGARLTAWELDRSGIPCTIMTDSMTASRLSRGDVSCVIVGADRIAANGDVANKIGTLGLALLARHFGVPFHVAAPGSTLDFDTDTGSDIPIEQRDPAEVSRMAGRLVAPSVPVWNPAFDVTPAELVTSYVTDRGLFDRKGLLSMARGAG